MNSMEGKVIAIIGATTTMGLATAQLLASRGATISLACIDEDALQKAKDSLAGDGHIHHVVELGNRAHVDSWIQGTVRALGKLDGAVNMAYIISTKPSPLKDCNIESWDKIFEVNARGTFNYIQAELNAMSPGASIVSAVRGYGGGGAPGYVAWGAAQDAIIGLSGTAARENPDIRVNCIVMSPGSKATNQHDGPEHTGNGPDETAQKEDLDPANVAGVIAFLLSDKASNITGAGYNANGEWVY
ncbi:L butanediol dehydrogenase [Fusarium heterosporum]|uniref:L butanediol dehydrogenase n=1 Tax=Fusarium heterosporum TaxID=42747 RepID=A0A8H5TCA3_FUSHE|nr:L butanediol dehydrogenase [Fusarium heterosporum]